jgi:hypothetical protein
LLPPNVLAFTRKRQSDAPQGRPSAIVGGTARLAIDGFLGRRLIEGVQFQMSLDSLVLRINLDSQRQTAVLQAIDSGLAFLG